MRILILVVFCCITAAHTLAQNIFNPQEVSAIILDEEVSQQMEFWEKQNRKESEVKVWRILVVGLSDRRSLNQSIKDFEEAFPELEYDWEYVRPLYKLKTGVCLDQLRLKPLLFEVRQKFPAALEIKDVVSYEDYFKLRQ